MLISSLIYILIVSCISFFIIVILLLLKLYISFICFLHCSISFFIFKLFSSFFFVLILSSFKTFISLDKFSIKFFSSLYLSSSPFGVGGVGVRLFSLIIFLISKFSFWSLEVDSSGRLFNSLFSFSSFLFSFFSSINKFKVNFGLSISLSSALSIISSSELIKTSFSPFFKNNFIYILSSSF